MSPRQGQRGSGGGGGMSREWGEFMEASKMTQVKDVWDVKGAEQGHKASKKELEEMTARFRSASASGDFECSAKNSGLSTSDTTFPFCPLLAMSDIVLTHGLSPRECLREEGLRVFRAALPRGGGF